MQRLSCFLASLILASALSACRGTVQAVDLSDAAVKSRLQSALKSQIGLNLRSVTLDVTDGVVTISGMVETRKDRYLIEDIARETKGVDQVLVNLFVPE